MKDVERNQITRLSTNGIFIWLKHNLVTIRQHRRIRLDWKYQSWCWQIHVPWRAVS
jgi:hypothetical protein